MHCGTCRHPFRWTSPVRMRGGWADGKICSKRTETSGDLKRGAHSGAPFRVFLTRSKNHFFVEGCRNEASRGVLPIDFPWESFCSRGEYGVRCASTVGGGLHQNPPEWHPIGVEVATLCHTPASAACHRHRTRIPRPPPPAPPPNMPWEEPCGEPWGRPWERPWGRPGDTPESRPGSARGEPGFEGFP